MTVRAAYISDEQQIGKLINDHVGLVQRIAHHMIARLPASIQSEDMIQAGMLGLLEAARRYNSHHGVSFRAFAERRIRGAMLDEIRKGDWTPRSVHRQARQVSAAIQAVEDAKGETASAREIADKLGISVEEYHDLLLKLRGQKLLSIEALMAEGDDSADYLTSPAPEPSEIVQREYSLNELGTAIENLPEREKLVLALYYDEGLNLKEIGLVLNVSESRVSQLHSQALTRLRARIDK